MAKKQKTISQELRYHLQQSHIQSVSNATKIDVTLLYRYANGDVSPSLRRAEMLCEYFGLSLTLTNPKSVKRRHGPPVL